MTCNQLADTQPNHVNKKVLIGNNGRSAGEDSGIHELGKGARKRAGDIGDIARQERAPRETTEVYGKVSVLLTEISTRKRTPTKVRDDG